METERFGNVIKSNLSAMLNCEQSRFVMNYVFIVMLCEDASHIINCFHSMSVLSDRQTADQYLIMGILNTSEFNIDKFSHVYFKAIGNALTYIIENDDHKFTKITKAINRAQVGNSTSDESESSHDICEVCSMQVRGVYSLERKDEEGRNSIKVGNCLTIGSESDSSVK